MECKRESGHSTIDPRWQGRKIVWVLGRGYTLFTNVSTAGRHAHIHRSIWTWFCYYEKGQGDINSTNDRPFVHVCVIDFGYWSLQKLHFPLTEKTKIWYFTNIWSVDGMSVKKTCRTRVVTAVVCLSVPIHVCSLYNICKRERERDREKFFGYWNYWNYFHKQFPYCHLEFLSIEFGIVVCVWWVIQSVLCLCVWPGGGYDVHCVCPTHSATLVRIHNNAIVFHCSKLQHPQKPRTNFAAPVAKCFGDKQQYQPNPAQPLFTIYNHKILRIDSVWC